MDTPDMHTVQQGSPEPSATAARLRGLLSKPVVGFIPWIVMSVLAGPHRSELACAIALGLGLLTALLGLAVGISVKLLDAAAVVFFLVLLVIGALVDANALHWLARWSSELSNIAIALIALCSIAFRTPFTIQYAREEVPRENWNSPLFLHINYVITWVWTVAFLITAIAGWIGDGPLNQPNNIWTSWLIQIGLIILAIKFTEWYPDYATARAEYAVGKRGDPGPGLNSLLLPLTGYISTIGIVLLIVGGTPWWVGVGLIVVGGYVTRALFGDGQPSAALRPGGSTDRS
jgi:hypothetical protein